MAAPKPDRSQTDAYAQEMYVWFSVPRVAAVTLVIGILAVMWAAGRLPYDPRPILYVLIPVFIALSAATWVLVMRGIRPSLVLHTQVLFDVVGTTVGILLTGGAHSPFIPLYILAVFSAGALSTLAGLGIGLLAVAFYVSITVTGHSVDGTGFPPYAFTAPDITALIILAAMLAIATLQSRFYVSRIRAKDDELLKLKDEFLFRTIHDVRGPAQIIGYVFEKYDLPASKGGIPGFHKDAAAVRNSLDRIDTLVNDLLQLGQDEEAAFRLEKERVELATMVRSVARSIGPAMKRKKITYRYVPAYAEAVLADGDKLREAFENIIGNAVKYNREGGDVRVSHRVRGRFVETDVADTGVGISEKSLQKMFTAYFRGDQGAAIPGTGLGLFSTKKLIERMGGSITVKSVQGIGTTFTVALPRA